jgi:hypothetical protein
MCHSRVAGQFEIVVKGRDFCPAPSAVEGYRKKTKIAEGFSPSEKVFSN